MGLEIVGRDHKIVGPAGTELTARRFLQPIVVPLRHHRQFQIQRGDGKRTYIAVAVDHDNRHFRVQWLRLFRFLCGILRRIITVIPLFEDGVYRLQQILGILSCLNVLVPVIKEQGQCRKDQHRPHNHEENTRLFRHGFPSVF